MNRQNKTGRSKGTRPFIMLMNAIYDHPAFKALTPHSKAIYFDIRRRYNGLNNGDIHMSVREAAACCGCGNGTAHKALKMLENHGFIVTTLPGLVHGTARRATTFRLTDEADSKNNMAPTRDFENWKPAENSFPSISSGTPRASAGTARISSGTQAPQAFHHGYTKRAFA
jgi:DNA-binding transcriptional regulator YhcF (GntR family)